MPFLLLSGETIKIVIEEYVQQLSGYFMDLKFDPALLFGSQFQYGNRIALEFSQLYHWHPLMPDRFLIDGDEVSYEQFLYNTSFLTHYGVDKMVEAFTLQRAGQVTDRFHVNSSFVRLEQSVTLLQVGGGHNVPAVVTNVAVRTMEESRQLRLWPFNEYRKRFNLAPYTSFRQFTGKNRASVCTL